MKNRCITYLVQWLKRSPAQLKHADTCASERKFLIVSTTGLGDTLWGTPAIRALRESYPTASLVVLTSPIGKELLYHNPHIDAIIVVKDPVFRSLIPLYVRLKKMQITDVLLFHTSQRPILPLTALIGAKRIIGTQGIQKGLDSLLTDALPKEQVHEIQRRLQIVYRAGARESTAELELPVGVEDVREAEQFLAHCPPSLPEYRICLHPGAKDLFKQWPPSHFIALGRRLTRERGCQIFVTGNPSEKELVGQITRAIPGAVEVTHLTLRACAAFLQQMGVVISNDTGPMHMAFAVKTPTVALFTPTDPKLCGPYHAAHVQVIAKKRTCKPCLSKQCRTPFCLLQISVEEVYEAVVALCEARALERSRD